MTDVASLAAPIDPAQPGPPLGVLIAGTVLGVITLVAVGFAWVTRRRAWAREP